MNRGQMVEALLGGILVLGAVLTLSAGVRTYWKQRSIASISLSGHQQCANKLRQLLNEMGTAADLTAGAHADSTGLTWIVTALTPRLLQITVNAPAGTAKGATVGITGYRYDDL